MPGRGRCRASVGVAGGGTGCGEPLRGCPRGSPMGEGERYVGDLVPRGRGEKGGEGVVTGGCPPLPGQGAVLRAGGCTGEKTAGRRRGWGLGWCSLGRVPHRSCWNPVLGFGGAGEIEGKGTVNRRADVALEKEQEDTIN